MRAKDNNILAQELQEILKKNNINVELGYVARVCHELKERATFVYDMWSEGHYFFEAPKVMTRKQ